MFGGESSVDLLAMVIVKSNSHSNRSDSSVNLLAMVVVKSNSHSNRSDSSVDLLVMMVAKDNSHSNRCVCMVGKFHGVLGVWVVVYA